MTIRFSATSFRFFSRTTATVAVSAFCLASFANGGEAVVGSGHVISETRAVSGFHGVELTGSGNVTVVQGNTEGLVIDAEDNILPLIDSTIGNDGVLRLGFKEHSGSVYAKKDVIFKLAAKTLDQVTSNGSGTIQAKSLAADKLRIDLRGSGDVAVDQVRSSEITTQLGGSGTVKLGGEAHGQKISVNGSGEYEAPNLKTDAVNVRINGSGSAKVWANASLSAEINGSGEVEYYGSPAVTKAVHGSGEVTSLGAKGN